MFPVKVSKKGPTVTPNFIIGCTHPPAPILQMNGERDVLVCSSMEHAIHLHRNHKKGESFSYRQIAIPMSLNAFPPTSSSVTRSLLPGAVGAGNAISSVYISLVFLSWKPVML
jgi:hypothetical protein